MSLLTPLRVASSSLRENPMRAALSMLGVIIGVASLVTVLALGDGMERFARDQIKGEGYQSVRVEPTDRNPSVAMSYETTDVTIASGEDHLFHLRASSPFGTNAVEQIVPRSGVFEVMTTVQLSNGDSYRCLFRVQIDQ